MKHILSVLFAFLYFSGAAQNLVPNPGFEDTLGCPAGYPDLDTKCKFWKSFRYTPDYFHGCSSICGFNNQYGFQEPRSGQAYAGIATYQGSDSTAREHIGVELTLPLVIGVKYYVTFYISAAWNNLLTNIATNKMGFRLSTVEYSDPGGLDPLPNSCTSYLDTIVSDTIGWYQVSGSFIADSAYEYLSIGNFFDDSLVDTINLPYQIVPQVAYYYLDDVVLSADSSYVITDNHTNKASRTDILSVYPNPTDNMFFVECGQPISSIQVFDSYGILVHDSEAFGRTNLQIQLPDLNAGLYHIKVQLFGSHLFSKIIVTN